MNPDRVAAALAEVRQRIDSVLRPWSHPVQIVAVTKGFGSEAITAASAAGATAIGENYAQELLSKRDAAQAANVEVQFIGGLQRNKVRQLVGLVDVWSSLDRRSVIDEVAKRAPGAQVQIQVNATGEAHKSGAAVDEVHALVRHAQDLGLGVVGLMAVGPTEGGPGAARPAFARTRSLVDELALERCSIGMSADLEVAVEEGATEVRIGTGLFGQRPTR